MIKKRDEHVDWNGRRLWKHGAGAEINSQLIKMKKEETSWFLPFEVMGAAQYRQD